MTDVSTCDKLAFYAAQRLSAKDFNGAVKLLEEAIQVGTQNKRLLSSIYCHLGSSHYYLNNYNESLEFYNKEISLNRDIKDMIGEGNALGNMANVLKSIGKFDEAIDLTSCQLKIANSVHCKDLKVKALWTLSVIYLMMAKRLNSQEQSFYELLDKSVRHLKNYISSVDYPGVALSCLGCCYYLSGNFPVAKKYFKLRLEDAITSGAPGLICTSQLNLGNCHMLCDEYEDAVYWYSSALNVAASDWALRIRAMISLAHSHWLAGNYLKSLEIHERVYTEALYKEDETVLMNTSLVISECFHSLNRIKEAVDFAEKHYDHTLQFAFKDNSDADSIVENAKNWLEHLRSLPLLNNSLGDLIERIDCGRLNDQRVSPVSVKEVVKPPRQISQLNKMLDIMQLTRMDDQRADLSLQSPEVVKNPTSTGFQPLRKRSIQNNKFFKRFINHQKLSR